MKYITTGVRPHTFDDWHTILWVHLVRPATQRNIAAGAHTFSNVVPA